MFIFSKKWIKGEPRNFEVMTLRNTERVYNKAKSNISKKNVNGLRFPKNIIYFNGNQ
jgi:hypothetical protein